jgi:prepilin-type N-terminal cleavage/methylation domain-containing protein
MKRPGFSLIETLITLSLSAFFVTATGQLLLHSLRLKQKSEADLGTTQLASAELESLRALSFEDQGLDAGQYEDFVEDPAIGCRFRRQWMITDVADGIKDIDITVSCENRRVRGARVRLRLSRELGF